MSSKYLGGDEWNSIPGFSMLKYHSSENCMLGFFLGNTLDLGSTLTLFEDFSQYADLYSTNRRKAWSTLALKLTN